MVAAILGTSKTRRRVIASSSKAESTTVRRSVKVCPLTLIVLVIVKSWACPAAQAAEGASSNYTPGTYGNLAVAVQPAPALLG